MPVLNKDFAKKIGMTLFAALVLAVPQICWANPGRMNQKNATAFAVAIAPVIIDRDESGAVIYRKGGNYFYALAKAQKIGKGIQIAPRELVVKYKNQSQSFLTLTRSPIAKTMRKYNAKTEALNRNLGLSLVQLPKDKNYFKTWAALKHNPDVAYAEPNYIVKAQAIPNDPYYAFQWGPRMIRTAAAWEKVDPRKRAAVTIAVLDSGVDANHPDLKDNIVPGYNSIDHNQNTGDKLGHGTHVAGIAAALAGNGAGIAGIASGCKIIPVKVLDDEGNGDDASIIEGIKYAADHGVQVINMSLGGPEPSAAIQEAVNYAVDRGVSVVAAAGNENGAIDMPGNCKGVIAVGAVDRKGKRASYSNFGPQLDIVAPGSDILSTYIGGRGPSGYAYLSGTSMAAPFVAGVAALVKAADPELTPAAVKEIIHQSAAAPGDHAFDTKYGYGLINADKAVVLALREAGIPSFAALSGQTPCVDFSR